MNKVKFTNLIQLKLIEEEYGISSLWQPYEFGVALQDFISKDGPQKLREILNENQELIEFHIKNNEPLTHEELIVISKQIFKINHVYKGK